MILVAIAVAGDRYLLSVPYSTGCSMIPIMNNVTENAAQTFSPLFYGVFNDTGVNLR